MLRAIKSIRMIIDLVARGKIKDMFVVMGLVLVTVCMLSSVAILHFEKDAPNGNIKSAEDALWFSLVTISTIGYGEKVVTTTEGRLSTIPLMILGVGMFSALSGMIAAKFLEKRENG